MTKVFSFIDKNRDYSVYYDNESDLYITYINRNDRTYKYKDLNMENSIGFIRYLLETQGELC